MNSDSRKSGVVMGYGRCSKAEKIQSHTRAAQEAAIASYARRELPGLPYKGMYFDPETSGKTNFASREAGFRLNTEMRSGDHFVIAKLDRAFRNPIDGLTTLDILLKRGIHVHALDYKIDSTTPMGELMITMGLAIARWERRVCAERTKAALQWKIANGLPVSSRVPFGWRVAGTKRQSRYVPCEEEQKLAIEIVARYDEKGVFRATLEMMKEGVKWRHKPVDRINSTRLRRAVENGFQLPGGVAAGQPSIEHFV